MAMEADSVLTYIGASRWRSAFFTSYTLSLTYVESHVLPRLKRSGCHSVDILADLVGYRDSLAEQKASGVGREYTLIPVHVPKGIFHPKLVHLWAEKGDDDLLLVGSGNLTYSGHGGNIEVLEALHAEGHSRAMQQAADFLEGLATHPNIAIADTKALLQTMQRLRDVASRGTDTGEVQFIHSLDKTGGQQFVEAARAIGGEWDDLLVLSPYHNPDAKPVLGIARELKVRRVSVGVSPRKGDTTTFPFHAAREKVNLIRAVAPVVPDGNARAFHAKWIEASGPSGALMLTGSFNATVQSLDSRNNVECGVLRVTAKDSSDSWHEVLQPSFKEGAFPQRSGGASHCLFAAMTASGQLTGRVLGQVQAGRWHALLEAEERTVAEGELELTDSLEFTWNPIALAGADLNGDTLRLTLEADSQVARGWVSATRILAMNSRQRSLMQALSRLQRGITGEDDLQCVLDVLAEEASALTAEIEAQTPVVTRPTGPELSLDDKVPEPTISLSEFVSSTGPSLHFLPNSAVDDIIRGRQGWPLLRHIVAALLALPVEPRKAGTQGGLGDTAPVVSRIDNEEPSAKKAQLNLKQQLANADERFEAEYQRSEQALTRARTAATREKIRFGQAQLLAVWSAVALRIGLLRLGDVERTFRFHFLWQGRVGKLALKDSRRDILVSPFCGITAALAWWLERDAVRGNKLDKSPKHLHRWLDRFFMEGYAREEVLSAARVWLSTETGKRLVDEDVDAALFALNIAMSVPVERRALANIFRDGLAAHEQEAVAALGWPSVDRLRKLLDGKAGAKPQYSLVDLANLYGCPACDRSFLTHRPPNGPRELDRELSWQLRHYGFAACPHCRKHVLVALEV